MGAILSKKTNPPMSVNNNEPVTNKVMRLNHPGSCTGMFWRGDPYTNGHAPTNDNWPRNGALLEGTGPHVVKNVRYFKVSAIQQAGSQGFKAVPDGTYMLYDQGGRVLHDIK